MKNIQNLTIDINKKPFQTITANTGEVASRFIRITILENNIPADLTGVTAYLYAKKADGTKVFNSVKVEDAKQGIVLAELTSQVLAIPGLVRLTLLLTKDGAKLASKQIIVAVDESAIDEEAIQSTNEFNALTDALKKVNNIDNKLDKNAVLSMANMGQDVREAMTGGSVAVVGKNSVLAENIANNQVTPVKTSFTNSISGNIIQLNDATYSGAGITVTVKNNIITISGKSTSQCFLKLTNNQEFTTSQSVNQSWVSDTITNIITTGEIYTMKLYKISGTSTNAKGVILSVRDTSRNSMLNSTTNTTNVIQNDASFIQFFIEQGVTFDNYQVCCGLVSGDTIPAEYTDILQYRLTNNISISEKDDNRLLKNINVVYNKLDNKINHNTNLSNDIRNNILNKLKDNGINIDYSVIENKLYSDEIVNFNIEGLDITINNGLITLNGTTKKHAYIKLTNGYDIAFGENGGNKKSEWGKQSALNILSIGKKYKTQVNIIGGSVLNKDGDDYKNSIVISGRNSNYKSVLSGSSTRLVELTEDISYAQLYLPVNVTFNNLQLYCGLYENIIPSEFIVKSDIDVLVFLPILSRLDNINPIRYQGNKSTIKEYPTMLKAKQVLEIPGTYFNAIQGGCTDGTYLYCGVVNNSNDKGNTTVHKIDVKNWEIVKTVTEYSLGHCNSMTYCDYDGYIHCIGLEQYNNYKVVHRITTDLEYVDSYTIDLSPYYSETTGIGAIDYNPNTEQFIFLIRGNKKGYAFYSKNKTFIKIVWTERLNGTYAGMSTDNNFIYQSVWVGGDTNTVGIFDYEGNTLANINITDMIGEIEETFIYKDKMISVANHGYTNHLVYEISLDDFISV